MDQGTLALGFIAIIFPLLTAGGTALPYVSPYASRSMLLIAQFFMYGVALLSLALSAIIALTVVQTLPQLTYIIVVIVVIAIIAFLTWLVFIVAALAVEDALYERMLGGRPNPTAPPSNIT